MSRQKLFVFDPNITETSPAGSCLLKMLRAASAEYDLEIFTTRTDLLQADGVTIHRVPIPMRPVFLQSILYTVAAVLFQLLKRGHGIRIATQGSFPFCDISYAHCCHRLFLDSYRSHITGGLFVRAARLVNHRWGAAMEGIAFRRARLIVVPSEGLANELISAYGGAVEQKLRIIANPVDCQHFARPPGTQGERFTFAFCALGNFEWKGLGLILQALASGIAADLNVIGGTNREIDEFRRLAESLGVVERVRFVGLQKDVRPHLWAADAFVFASIYETFPLVCLQAAAAGLPLIATDLYGLEELLLDGISGWRVSRSVEEVSRAMGEAVSGREKTREMGRRAQQLARRYDTAAFQERWLEELGFWAEPRHAVDPAPVSEAPAPADALVESPAASLPPDAKIKPQMTYDVVIIGSGPGGYSAAVRAGQYGLKTALIEKQTRLGGTCLLVGCIPTKTLLHTADVWDYFKNPGSQGISCTDPKLNYPQVLEKKNKIVNKHSKGIDFLMRKNKVDVIKGTAKLLGGGKIEVAGAQGTQTVEAKNIILATGSEARMIPGVQADAELILTNIELLDSQTIAPRLGIIGAGAVGVEFASIFNRFGSKVTVLEMLPRLVPVEDEEISKELEKHFKKIGIRCETGAKAENIRRNANSVSLTVTLANGDKEEMEFDKLLVAVGRKPNTDAVGIENTKAELDRGFVKVNGFQQTAEPNLYAIGDVVAGTPQLAHVATAEGMIAVAHIAGKPSTPINRNRIPGATYTDPGIGSVGLTEAQARAQGYKVKIGKFPFVGNSKATILDKHEGFVKVVSEEKFGEILGVHIIGPEGFELISEAVTAMEAEATVDTMINTIHAHPTIYEAIGEAFNGVYGQSINI